MRKVLIVIAALGLGVGIAQAGDYHYKDSLICSDCHVMHGTVSHTAVGWFSTQNINGGAGYDYLIKAATETALCLTCHDGQGFAPDVLHTKTGTATNRSAGALNDGSGTGGYLAGDGHTLGSADAPPGFVGTWSGTLECENCHDKHGWMGPGVAAMTIDDIGANGYNEALGGYRNLQPRGKFGPAPIVVSYELAQNNTADVYEAGVADYNAGMVELQEPTQTNSGFAHWCGSCHGDFHGADVTAPPYDAIANPAVGGVGYVEFNKHPASTVNIGEVGGGHSNLGLFAGHAYRVRVMSATGGWTQGGPWAAAPADLTPTCLSCHKGHGTNNPFGLIYFDPSADDPAVPATENGSGDYRTLCGNCHVQAE